MLTFTLPKYAVVSAGDGGRLIHIGGGKFICADAQAPGFLETAVPAGEKSPKDASLSGDTPQEYDFTLGRINVISPPKPEPGADPEAPAT